MLRPKEAEPSASWQLPGCAQTSVLQCALFKSELCVFDDWIDGHAIDGSLQW